MYAYALLVFFITQIAPTLARAEAWSEDSNPFVIGPRYQSHLTLLPESADLAESARPWSGPFWADRRGSIGYRWQTGEKMWKTRPPTEVELRSLSRGEIARLSPAEKIDIIRSRFDYPTVADIRRFASSDSPRWHGLCAGWSQSALGFFEPVAASFPLSDGVFVDFTSDDLKALAAYYYDRVAVSSSPENPYDDRAVAQIGRKCFSSGSRERCGSDLNPGALHILLANRIGLESRGLIADFSKTSEVWQHPISGYHAQYRAERAPSNGAAVRTAREVRVRLEIHYTDYTSAGSGHSHAEAKRVLEYWLELDSDSRIIGGSYVNRPGKLLDYAWVSDAISFGRGYEVLNQFLVPRFLGTSLFPSFTSPIELRSGG